MPSLRRPILLATLGLLPHTAAFAAGDADGDSVNDDADVCPSTADDQTDTDGDGWGDACAHPTATIDPTAVLGANAYVSANSWVGEYATIGAYAFVDSDVIVGSRVTLADGTSPLDRVTLGSGTVLDRRATVAAGATVSGATIGRAVTVGAGASIVGATVGYAAEIGSGAEVLAGSILGSLVRIGDGATVSANAVLARGGWLKANASLGAGSVVGPDVVIAENAQIGEQVRVRKDVTIGIGAIVGQNARVGRGVRIGDAARIGSWANLNRCEVVADAVIPDNATDCAATTGGGVPAWMDALRVGREPGDGNDNERNADVFVDSAGNVTVAWAADGLHVRRYDAVTGWGPIVDLSDVDDAPRIVGRSGGQPVIVARGRDASTQYPDVRVWTYDPALGWSAPTVVWSPTNETAQSVYAVVADDDTVILAYDIAPPYAARTVYTRMLRPNGTLGPQTAVPSNLIPQLRGVAITGSGPTLDVSVLLMPYGSGNSDVYVVEGVFDPVAGTSTWSGQRVDESTRNLSNTAFAHSGDTSAVIWSISEPPGLAEVATKTGDGSWTRHTFTDTDRFSTDAQIAALPNGSFLAAFVTFAGSTYSLHTTTYTPSSGWSARDTLASGPSLSYVQLETNAAGDALMVYTLYDSVSDGDRVYVLERPAGGAWQSFDPVDAPEPSLAYTEPSLSLADGGRAAVVWQARGPWVFSPFDPFTEPTQNLFGRFKR